MGVSPLLVRTAIVVVAATAGAASVLYRGLVTQVAVLAVGAAFVFGLGPRIVTVFHVALASLLVGYLFLGKSFAYLGAGPVFVGEGVLVLGVVSLAYRMRLAHLGGVHVLLLLFMAWGVITTVPYFGQYGLVTLRDAVTWGYGMFALILSMTVTPRHLERAIALYRRVLPVFLLWAPMAAALVLVATLPMVPGAGVPIISFKGGDTGVHLAGAAAFILLGLYGDRRDRPVVPEAVVWLLWFGAAAVVAVVNRGGTAATAMLTTSVLFVRNAGRWALLAFVGTSILVGLVAVNPRVDLGYSREFSFGQFIENIGSIFGSTEEEGLQGTKEFRLAWWGTIVDYTFFGDYFWTGKGFGINLADDDGFQPTADGSLRAPHNGHFEILARMGVPGLILWVLFMASYAASLVRAAWRSRQRGHVVWPAVLGFLFVYWAAVMVNSSFDPYLQGPQGGIWFWSLVGIGLAAVRHADREPHDLDVEPIVAGGPTRAGLHPARA